MFNFNTEANHKRLETLTAIGGAVFTVLIAVGEFATVIRDTRRGLNGILDVPTYDYAGAIKAITGSDMYSFDKKELVNILVRGETEDFYRAIANVAQSDMVSFDKVKTIKNMCKHD